MKTNLKMVDENFIKEKEPKKEKHTVVNTLCSVMEWKNMDREVATQKECQERKKLIKPFGKNNKYVWVGIGLATKRS